MSEPIKQFPHIYRVNLPNVIGVKAYVGKSQYGEARTMQASVSVEDRKRIIEGMERDLVKQVSALAQ